MKRATINRLLSSLGAIALVSLVSGCALPPSQPKGQIVVQAVSWPLVKKYAEPDAGLPDHKMQYLVLGVGDEPEQVAVESGQTVKLKLIVH